MSSAPIPPAPAVLVLGAGPAGLACAMELSRHGVEVAVAERQPRVGGLAATLRFDEGEHTFLTDIGPHRFFSKNRYLYDFIDDLLQEEWRSVPRRTRQWIDGAFYDYPVNAPQVLRNLGVRRSVRVLVDYARARLTYGLFRRPMRTFEDYVVANFGRSLAEFNMINYTEKIWGIPVSQIHPDWAHQRISGLNLWSVVRNALGFGRRTGGPKSLVDEFFYPQYGTGRIYEAITERLRAAGAAVRCSTEVVAVHHADGRITEVRLRTDDGECTVRPDHLVESVPITRFLELLDPPPPPEVLAAAGGLRWRNQVYLFLTLDKESVTTDNWIYFPGADIPFGRVSEMRNFSADMSPPGATSLFIEFFAFDTDPVWAMSESELLDLVMPYFEQWGFFTRSDVRRAYLMRREHVYPVYDLEYAERLAVVKRWLDGLENLVYVGRPGRFMYTNQDHSLEMGIVAARTVIEGPRYDMNGIGAENEYFEQGVSYQR